MLAILQILSSRVCGLRYFRSEDTVSTCEHEWRQRRMGNQTTAGENINADLTTFKPVIKMK